MNMNIDKKLGISLKVDNDFEKYVFGNTIDELIEGLDELKDSIFINKFVKEFSPCLCEEHFTRLDRLILKSNNSEQIVKYACYRDTLSNVDDFETTLIKLDNIFNMVDFSRRFRGNNFTKIQEKIIKCNNPIIIFHFSLIKDSRIDLIALKKAIMDTGSLHEIINFFVSHQDNPGVIEKSDTIMLQHFALESNNIYFITRVASQIKNADIPLLQLAVINSKDARSMLKFATEVNGTNIEELRFAIYNTNNKEVIMDFNKTFPPTCLKSETTVDAKNPAKHCFSFLSKLFK